MRRLLLLCLGLALTAGCQPRDPLDWKISARTPADYERWFGKTMIRLPEDLAAELSIAITKIVTNTPIARVANREVFDQDTTHPVCRQLHHRTIREAIIEGYLVSNTSLLRKTNLELGDIAKFTQQLNQLEPGTRQYEAMERVIAYRQKVVEAAKAQLENNHRRIAELERQPTPR